MKWTFAITYLGGEYLSSVIKSIKNQQNIDEHEILVIGPRNENLNKIKSEVKSIIFDESLVKGWITMKKNILAQNAEYENVCMMHEYVGLCEGWYDGFEKFGYEWDVCMNPIRMSNGLRYRDWITMQRPINFISYSDSTKTKEMYISGTYWCGKRSFMTKNPQDIQRAWGMGEDIEWAMRCNQKWNYKLNPHSVVKLLKEKPKSDWNPDPKLDPDIDLWYNETKVQE